jgi:hypothetical protein
MYPRTITITAASLAMELGGKRTSSGYIAKCPVHEDNNPSLSISEPGGKVLVHCFVGCRQQDVIDALRARGLWLVPQPEKPTRAARNQMRREREDRQAAECWGRSAEALARLTLENLDSADPERAAITRLVLRITGGPSSILAAYREWKAAHSELTAAMVRAGRASDARWQRKIALALVRLFSR